jgi:biotin-(acetyl-CoA carboxylase) ligase
MAHPQTQAVASGRRQSGTVAGLRSVALCQRWRAGRAHDGGRAWAEERGFTLHLSLLLMSLGKFQGLIATSAAPYLVG